MRVDSATRVRSCALNRLPEIELELAHTRGLVQAICRHYASFSVQVCCFLLPSDLPAATILVTELPAQAPLKPGAEPCDQALLHSSTAVLQSKRNLISHAEQIQDRIALFEKTIVQATDVVLHCEMTAPTMGTPRTLPRIGTSEYIEASLSHLFEARIANSTGDSAETAQLELSVSVITPPGSPTIRVVECLIGNQGKDGHIRLTYAPNPKRLTATANNGQLIQTNLRTGSFAFRAQTPQAQSNAQTENFSVCEPR